MDEKHGLESLRVWQQAIALAVRVHKEALPHFPREERHALALQLRRAVQSVPANIAEGYGRYTYKDSLHFYYIARGSLEETYSHLLLAHRLGYLSKATFDALVTDIQNLRRSLNGYLKFLKNHPQR